MKKNILYKEVFRQIKKIILIYLNILQNSVITFLL